MVSIPFLTYKVPEKRHEGKNVHQWPWNIIPLLPFFLSRLRLCSLLGMTANGEGKKEKHKSTPKHPEFESCACVRISIMKRPEKISLEHSHRRRTKDSSLFPFFSLLSCLCLGWSCCCCLLRIPNLLFARNVKRRCSAIVVKKMKVTRRVINLRINSKGARVTPASHYRIPLVGNLAENKQLWRLQSHVTQLEKGSELKFGTASLQPQFCNQRRQSWSGLGVICRNRFLHGGLKM